MTKEEKKLLIKDLCARAHCGVKCHKLSVKEPKTIVGLIPNSELIFVDKATIFGPTEEGYNIELIKPYLRPMSSMTKKEREIYESLAFVGEARYANPTCCSSVISFLEENHLDYNHFIEKGLALEAPEGMYKIMEE